jgi:hypothetical protein
MDPDVTEVRPKPALHLFSHVWRERLAATLAHDVEDRRWGVVRRVILGRLARDELADAGVAGQALQLEERRVAGRSTIGRACDVDAFGLCVDWRPWSDAEKVRFVVELAHCTPR